MCELRRKHKIIIITFKWPIINCALLIPAFDFASTRRNATQLYGSVKPTGKQDSHKHSSDYPLALGQCDRATVLNEPIHGVWRASVHIWPLRLSHNQNPRLLPRRFCPCISSIAYYYYYYFLMTQFRLTLDESVYCVASAHTSSENHISTCVLCVPIIRGKP